MKSLVLLNLYNVVYVDFIIREPPPRPNVPPFILSIYLLELTDIITGWIRCIFLDFIIIQLWSKYIVLLIYGNSTGWNQTGTTMEGIFFMDVMCPTPSCLLSQSLNIGKKCSSVGKLAVLGRLLQWVCLGSKDRENVLCLPFPDVIAMKPNSCQAQWSWLESKAGKPKGKETTVLGK